MANTKPFSTWSSTGTCSLFAIFICNLTHIANNPLPLSHLYLSIHFIETAYQPILCSTTLTITSFTHHRLPKVRCWTFPYFYFIFPNNEQTQTQTNTRTHRRPLSVSTDRALFYSYAPSVIFCPTTASLFLTLFVAAHTHSLTKRPSWCAKSSGWLMQQ